MAGQCSQQPLDAFDSLFCQYQLNDGGANGDAPDTCGDPGRPVPKEPRTGLLVPGDDEEDHYFLDLGAGATNVTLEQPHSTTLAPGASIVLEVRPVTDGACGDPTGARSTGQSTAYLFGLPSDTQTVSLAGLPQGRYDVGVRMAYGAEAMAGPAPAAGPMAVHASPDGVGIDGSTEIQFMCQPYCGLSTNTAACTWGIQITQPVDSALCYLVALGIFLGSLANLILGCVGPGVPPTPNIDTCLHIVMAAVDWLATPGQTDSQARNVLPLHYRIAATTD